MVFYTSRDNYFYGFVCFGVITLFLKGVVNMVNSGIFSQIFEEAGINESDLMVFAGIMLVYFAFIGIIALALYLLQAIGLYRMAKKVGFSSPWRGFIPFANTFLFGKIAEKYVKKDGKPSAKFGGLLLAFEILTLVLAIVTIAFTVSMIFVLVSSGDETELAYSIVAPMVTMFISCFVLMGVSIAYIVLYYVALWRIFTAFDYNNATVYFVLSILFSFLGPIFIFVLRNKQPVFDQKERFNYLMNK